MSEISLGGEYTALALNMAVAVIQGWSVEFYIDEGKFTARIDCGNGIVEYCDAELMDGLLVGVRTKLAEMFEADKGKDE